MRKSTKLVLAQTTLAAMFAVPGLAAAQDTAAQQDAEDPSASSQARPAGEIIVTARRREEVLTDVPISISAFSGEALQTKGVSRLDELEYSTPNVRAIPSTGRRSVSTYEIRGMKATEALMTVDPAVGIYVNEVYLARATGANQSFYDIANVQVLFGPQGTLFGRNTSAGAVLINTNLPTDRLEGEVSAGYGNLNRIEATAVLNVPVSDSLALRFAGQRVRRDGYFTNLSAPNTPASGKPGALNTWAGRFSARFKSGAFTNTTVFSYYKANEPSTPLIVSGAGPGASATLRAELERQKQLGFYQAFLDPFTRDFAGRPISDIPVNFTAIPNGYERARSATVTNTTTFDLTDDIVLKNIFGYHDVLLQASTDFDGTPRKLVEAWYSQDVRQFSNELQLQGKTGRLNWVVGGLYFHEKGQDINTSQQNITTANRQPITAVNVSKAVFAQATYEILDGLSLTAGARYSWDTRRVIYDDPATVNLTTGVFTCTVRAIVGPAPAPCYLEREVSFSEPTWTASIDYKITPDILVYAAHRHGYRSGGFASRVPSRPVAAIPFRPETVNDVEVGYKGTYRFGDDASAYTNIALYKAWFNDLQQSVAVFDPENGLTTTATLNAAKATIQGLEAEAGITPVRGLTLSGYLGIIDAKYNTFQSSPTETFTDVPFPISKLTFGVNVLMTPIDDPERGQVRLTGGYSYRSETFADNGLPADPRPAQARVPPQHNVNISLDWNQIMGSGFSAQVWGKNLTNEVRILGTFSGLTSTLAFASAFIGEPRTYGLTLKYEFGR